MKRIAIFGPENSLSRGLRIVAAFAAAGFTIPWLLLLCYAIGDRFGIRLSAAPLLYLCPSSIASLGLDSASWYVGILGWIGISLHNAVLYSLFGGVIALLVPLGRRILRSEE